MKIMKTILMLMLTAIIVIFGSMTAICAMFLALDTSNELTIVTIGTVTSLLLDALMINECKDMIWGGTNKSSPLFFHSL